MTVSTVPDIIDDDDRELVLSYSEATGTGSDDVPTPASNTLTITDDDLPIASITTTATTITEAAAASAAPLPDNLDMYDCSDNSYCARVTVSLSSAPDECPRGSSITRRTYYQASYQEMPDLDTNPTSHIPKIYTCRATR